MDGMYALVAGKADEFESPRQALSREVFEEVGISVAPEDLEHVVTIHHAKADYKAQKLDVIEFYFKPSSWTGTPSIKEPEKASELAFFELNALPTPMPKGLALALESLQSGKHFIEN